MKTSEAPSDAPSDVMNQLLKSINEQYLSVHQTKEKLFWTTYMGTNPQPEAFEQAEIRFKEFISNPQYLNPIREELKKPVVSLEDRVGLEGWISFFECHSIENEEALELQKRIVEAEAKIFQDRKHHSLFYENEEGEKVEASTRQLSENLSANDSEKVRQSSHEALLELEKWIVQSGYLELVELRNQFAKVLGFENYFEMTVQKNEKMSTLDLFKILDGYESLTRESNLRSLDELARQKGENSLKAHNLKFSVSGDTTRAMDPYLPFSKSVERWITSFHALGIEYRNATLSLDLIERKGKYENGFMHGVTPCFKEESNWVPAEINFTSNATPNQIGSGYNGLATLFHEGGHAAHFSNITMNSPCFSQEFPPTSMAYAETQSMFLDSLISDADWLTLYAKDAQGKSIPKELILENIENKQPFFNYGERSILVVPYFERNVYEMTKEERTPEHVIERARYWEKTILGIECSPRPLLAIPHLLGGDSSCSYHGYLLANMAVYQTRAFFQKRDGYLTNNPKIGPDLSKHYWSKGNSTSHTDTLFSLTKEGFNPQYLADCGNRTVEEAKAEAIQQIETRVRSTPELEECNLKAKIQLVHGEEVISSNEKSYGSMCAEFEEWISKNYSEE